MSSTNNIEMRLLLRDEATGRLKSAVSQAQQSGRQIQAADARTAAQTRRVTEQTTQHQYRLLNQHQAAVVRAAQVRMRTAEQAARAEVAAESRAAQARAQAAKAGMDSARTANAHKLLGIRSEREIQAEIRRTQNAYNHLAKSGALSQRELKRATAALRDEHRRLNQELKGGGGGGWGKAGQVVAGAAGAAATAYSVVNPKLDRNDALDQAKRRNAALMDDGGTLESRRATLEDVNAQVKDTVKYGVSQDFALEVQNKLLSRGGLDKAQVGEAMKVAAYANVASGGEAQAADLAVMQSSLLDFGFAADQLKDAVGKIYAATEVGSYEVADFARNAGEQLSVAKSIGMRGERDLAFLAALNQNAAAISGSPDEGANNFKQLMGATSNPQVRAALKKAGIENVDGRYLHGLKNGQNPIEVLDGMIQEILGKSQEWQQLQASMRAAKSDDEKMEIARRQEKYLEGTIVGKILTDEQRRMGYVAYAGDREGFRRNFDTLQAADRTAMDVDFAFQEEGSAVKTARGRNQQDLNEERAYKEMAGKRGELYQWWAEFSGENPGVGAAASGGFDLAKTVAGYGLGSMIFGRLMGGGAQGGLAAAGGKLASTVSTAAPLALRALPVIGGAVGLWHGNKTINEAQGKGFFEGGLSSRASGYGQSALGGAAVGAAIGSIVPVLGTAVGAAVGGGIGLLSAAVADIWQDTPAPASGMLQAGGAPAMPPVQPMLESPLLQQSAQQYSDAAAVQQQAGVTFAESTAIGVQTGQTFLQSAAQMQSSAVAMQQAAGLMQHGVQVRVTVENGNIMAHVDQAVSRAVRRNGG